MPREADGDAEDRTGAPRLAELFEAALERPADERLAWLAQAVPDAGLRADVCSLLEHHAGRGRLDSLMERLDALHPRSATTAELEVRLSGVLGARYRLEREVGRGGMAIVFQAEDLKHRRTVAVKVLRPELSSGIGAARFLQEIRIASGLVHPHILPVHDSAEAESLLLYVTPYHSGETLRELLVRRGRLNAADALQIAEDVAGALHYAHSHGVVHCDIKPENILLAGRHAVVGDFGIARAISAAVGAELGDTAVVPGTPAYMSPEQIRGDPALDHRSDVYSLGCVVLEMLTGRPPFAGQNVGAVLGAHLDEAPSTGAAPRAARVLLRRALAKVPSARFPDAVSFTAALREAFAARVPRQEHFSPRGDAR